MEGTRHLPQGIIREKRHRGQQMGGETGSLPGFFLRSHKKEKAGHLTVACLYWLMGGAQTFTTFAAFGPFGLSSMSNVTA
jgi:hypothetical protein